MSDPNATPPRCPLTPERMKEIADRLEAIIRASPIGAAGRYELRAIAEELRNGAGE